MANLITEPVSTSKYYTEYINTIMRYKIQNQQGIFIRYYNVNVATTGNLSNTKSTIDSRSDHVYDVYEYTPTWNIDEITDTAEDNPEKMGFAFDGVTGVTIYTISNPRIHDLISFSYAPYTTDHVYRVKGISTVLNVRDVGANIFKLELENAFNISDLSKLNISGRYVFSMFDKKNIEQLKYESIMQEQSIVMNALSTLTFNRNLELYEYMDNLGAAIVPLYANRLIFDLLSQNNIRQYFLLETIGNISAPWGISKFTTVVPDSYLDVSTGSVITGTGVIRVSSVNSILNYTTSLPDIAIQDCAQLLSLFRG